MSLIWSKLFQLSVQSSGQSRRLIRHSRMSEFPHKGFEPSSYNISIIVNYHRRFDRIIYIDICLETQPNVTFSFVHYSEWFE